MSETRSAYSVEEHMFKQDEIQKRHPQSTAAAVASSRSWNPPQPADKPVRCQCESVIGSNIDCPWCNSHRQHLELKKQSATIAERDRTIAELRAEVAEAWREMHAARDAWIDTVRKLEHERDMAKSSEGVALELLAALRRYVDEEFKERDLDWRNWPTTEK